MKKYTFLLIFLSFTLCGQSSNSLFMVMSANSMLERPEVFRKMQISLTEELGTVEYGFGVETIQKKITKFNTLIKESLDSIKIELSFKMKINHKIDMVLKTEYLDLSSIPSEKKTFYSTSSIINPKFNYTLKNVFSKNLSAAINSINVNDKTKTSILYSITKTLIDLGYIKKTLNQIEYFHIF